jgi:hypothetical protein
MSAVLMPATVVVVFFSFEILALWTQNLTVAAHTQLILRLLIIGYCLNGLMMMPYALQLAYGWTTLSLGLNLTAAILLMPLMVVLALRYAGIGAAAVWILLNGIGVTVGVRIMHKRLLPGEQRSWYLVDVAGPLLAALAIAAAGRWACPSQLPPLVMGAYLVVVCAATQAGALMAAPSTRRWIAGLAGRWVIRKETGAGGSTLNSKR